MKDEYKLKETYSSKKEPCISEKEPCISENECGLNIRRFKDIEAWLFDCGGGQ